MHLPHLIRSRAENFLALREAGTRRALAGTLVAGVIAVFLVSAGTLSAQAATTRASSAGLAAAATPYQNKVLNAAMARVAGGTRVSPDEVQWDGGKIALGVSAADTSSVTPGTCPNEIFGFGITCGSLTCAADFFCAWGAPSSEGDCWMYISADASGFWFDWAEYSGADCGSAGTWSWQNDSPFRVWKEQDHSGGAPAPGDGNLLYDGGTGSGSEWCISPNVGNSDVTDSVSRTLGWIQMTSNTASCPPAS